MSMTKTWRFAAVTGMETLTLGSWTMVNEVEFVEFDPDRSRTKGAVRLPGSRNSPPRSKVRAMVWLGETAIPDSLQMSESGGAQRDTYE